MPPSASNNVPGFNQPNTNPNPTSQSSLTPAAPFRNAAQAIQIVGQDLRDKQAVRYNFTFPQSVAVPNNGQRAMQIVVDADSDFYCERITGSALGPTDDNGYRLTDEHTNFPLVGTSLGYADRGLMVSIKDGGSRIELTDGFVPLELIFTPGYDVGTFYMPYPFKYYVRRTAKLVFTFMNRDIAQPNPAIEPAVAQPVLYHFASISLNGYKFLPKTQG